MHVGHVLDSGTEKTSRKATKTPLSLLIIVTSQVVTMLTLLPIVLSLHQKWLQHLVLPEGWTSTL